MLAVDDEFLGLGGAGQWSASALKTGVRWVVVAAADMRGGLMQLMSLVRVH